MLKRILVPVAAFLVPWLAAQGATNKSGVTEAEIVIGQCAALSGPAAGLGSGMSEGMKAAFAEINAKGGVHGRTIRLNSADDGYEPEQCVDCTEKMITEQGVFALAGYVGTPTAKVAMPIVQELKIPLVGLFTGAGLLRSPVQRYVINLRASYDDETEALVDHLSKGGVTKFAIFYQNDSFGLSGLAGVEKALQKRQKALTAKGMFERNTLAVKSGLAEIMGAAPPEAIIIIGPYKPTAEFIRAAREAGVKARFATISFVGTENLIADLAAQAEGVLISQVVPVPGAEDVPAARQYRAALQAAVPGAKPSFVSFEGYLSARLLIEGLTRAGKDLTREKLVDAFEAMSKLDLGGLTVSFSAANHQGSASVFLTEVKAGKAAPVE